MDKAKLPTHISLSANSELLNKDSVILLEQIRTIDKARLRDYVGSISHYDMKQIESKLIISLGINKYNL